MLLKSLFVGVVTTDYPARAQSLPPGTRGRPHLDPTRCTGSGACAEVCPTGAIRVLPTEGGQPTWELDLAACLFCGLCMERCESGALENGPEFELAARSREALRVRFTVGGEP